MEGFSKKAMSTLAALGACMRGLLGLLRRSSQLDALFRASLDLVLKSVRVYTEIATVGLGVSDFGYRIFVSVVSVVSCMDWKYRFGA